MEVTALILWLVLGIISLIIGLLLIIAPALVEKINIKTKEMLFPKETFLDRRIIIGILFIAVGILFFYIAFVG